MTQLSVTITEPVSIGEALKSGASARAQDGFRAVPRVVPNMRVTRAALDTLTVAEAFDTVLAKVIHDAIRLVEAVWPNLRFGATITENTVQIAARLALAYPLSASDALSFEDALKCITAAQVIEKLRLASVVNPQATYNITLTQMVRLSDAIRRFFGGEAIDAFEFSDALVVKPVLGAHATEGVGINDTLAPHFILRAVCADNLALAGEWLPGMIYAGKILEGVELSAGLFEPNGSIATWAVNVKNGAVTTYENFAFNSFGQMGLKYLGASSDGLYELNGENDDGAQIIAKLKGGFMSFGQMHLSSIKGVYLGIRGGGEFFLKIEDGAGHATTYRALSRDFETTRINTGKGLRARFFRFELTSTGQDFDVEAIEFIPLVQARRG